MNKLIYFGGTQANARHTKTPHKQTPQVNRELKLGLLKGSVRKLKYEDCVTWQKPQEDRAGGCLPHSEWKAALMPGMPGPPGQLELAELHSPGLVPR